MIPLEAPAYQGIDEGHYGRVRGAEFISGLSSRPGPCDDCPSRERCRAERLACRDFAHFVLRGKLVDRDRNPSAGLFMLLFPEDGPGRKRRRIRTVGRKVS